jgi:hopanoid biosynthesis associated RND transporter like protein HpnN
LIEFHPHETTRNPYLRALVWLVEGARRAAGWVLGGAVALTAVLGYYTATHLSIDTNALNMLDAELPFRKLDREFVRSFPQFSDLIVAVIDADTPAAAESTAERLAERLRREPGLFRSIYVPGQEAFFARNGLLYLDKAELWALAEHLTVAQPYLATLGQDPSLRGLFSLLRRALAEDIGAQQEAQLKQLLDEINTVIQAQLDGRPQRLSWGADWFGKTALKPRTFVLLQPRLDYTSLEPAAQALTKLKNSAADLVGPARMRLTGSAAMESEELISVSHDAAIATALAFALVCALLAIALRSLRLVVAVLATLFIGLTWTAAFAAFAIGSLNLISITFAVLFIGMAVDFGIQFAMRYQEEAAGGSEGALSRAAAGVGGALTLAAIAAALGFFSFIPTSYRGLAELGVIAGVSMFIALFANLTVLPALLALLAPRSPRMLAREGGVLARFDSPIQRHSRKVLWAAALAAAGSILLLPQARFDLNPLNMRDPSTESVATFRELMQDADTTPYTIQIVAEHLKAAEQLVRRLESLEVVDKAVTLASYVPENQDEKLAILDDLAFVLSSSIPAAKPRDPPSVEEQLEILASFRSKLTQPHNSAGGNEFGLSRMRLAEALDRLQKSPGWPDPALSELENRLVGDLPQLVARLRTLLTPTRASLADLPQELKERYLSSDGQARIEVYPKQNMSDNAALRRFVRAVQDVAPNAIGVPVELVEAADAVVRACLYAAVLALAATLILTTVVLRSVVDALLVLAPLLLALALMLATSVLIDLPFDFANIITLPLLVALNNAYGIYLVMRKRSAGGVAQLYRSSTPRAVLFSALTTMASFGTLTISRHLGISGMGVLITLALSYVLLCTLVVLPAVMSVIDERRMRSRAG